MGQSTPIPSFADPQERLVVVVRVWVLHVVDEELACTFITRVADALDRLRFLEPLVIAESSVAVRPNGLVFHEVNVGVDRWSRLEHEGLEAVLGQLLGSPPAGYPGADDDGVELASLFHHSPGVSRFRGPHGS
jgi:hypothetical protein